jgi:hypothetical protein
VVGVFGVCPVQDAANLWLVLSSFSCTSVSGYGFLAMNRPYGRC